MALQRPAIVPAGTTYVQQIATGDKLDPTWLQNETATTMGALINSAAAAVPNNSDLIATAESAGLLKQLTWTNAKAFLKTYFDTIYYLVGGTDVAVADGGTGSSTASGARTNLGLAIGTNVQAFNGNLATLAALTSASDRLPYFDDTNSALLTIFTAFARTLLDDANKAAAQLTLGIPRRLFSHHADATTTGTTEETLYTDTIAAGTFVNDDDVIEGEYTGILANNANTKRFTVWIGGTLVLDSDTIATITANRDPWRIRVSIMRVSNTVIRCHATVTGKSFAGWTKYLEMTALNLTTTSYAIDIKGTTANAAGDITARTGYIIYCPA